MNEIELRAINNLVDQLAEANKRISKLERKTDLSRSAIDSGSIDVLNEQGEVALSIGTNDDGTSTVSYVAGPTPATPSAPRLTQVVGALVVTWDGRLLTEDGETGAPQDFQHVGVYITQDEDPDAPEPFDLDTAELAGVITSPEGGSKTFGLDYGRYEVRLVAMSRTGQYSLPSEPVTGDVELIVDAPDLSPVLSDLDERLGLAGTELAESAQRLEELRKRFVYSELAPSPADAEDRAEGSTWTQTQTVNGTTTEIGRWQLKAGTWLAVGLDPTVIPDLLGYLATFQQLDVSKLIASQATMSTAVVLKLFTEIFTAKKITADQIEAGSLTATSLSSDAINGKTIIGATIIGGQITMDNSEGSTLSMTPGSSSTNSRLEFGTAGSSRKAVLSADTTGGTPRIYLQSPANATYPTFASLGFRAGNSSKPPSLSTNGDISAQGVVSGTQIEAPKLTYNGTTSVVATNGSGFLQSVLGTTVKASFEATTAGNLWLNTSGSVSLRIDPSGNMMNSQVYSNTATSAANMGITSTGWFFRSTSKRDSKLMIETFPDELADKLLNVLPRTWIDRGDAERLAEHEKLMNLGVLTEEQQAKANDLYSQTSELRRIAGFVAEEFDDAGLEIFVTKSRDQDGNETIEGLAYDRISAALLSIVQRQQHRISSFEERLSALERKQ